MSENWNSGGKRKGKLRWNLEQLFLVELFWVKLSVQSLTIRIFQIKGSVYPFLEKNTKYLPWVHAKKSALFSTIPSHIPNRWLLLIYSLSHNFQNIINVNSRTEHEVRRISKAYCDIFYHKWWPWYLIY